MLLSNSLKITSMWIASYFKSLLFFSSFSDPGPHLLHIQVEDDNEADLYSKFQTACTFIGNYMHYDSWFQYLIRVFTPLFISDNQLQNTSIQAPTCIYQHVCLFLDTHKDNNHVVLVFSNLGISRSATIVLAYLIHKFKWSLQVCDFICIYQPYSMSPKGILSNLFTNKLWWSFTCK